MKINKIIPINKQRTRYKYVCPTFSSSSTFEGNIENNTQSLYFIGV